MKSTKCLAKKNGGKNCGRREEVRKRKEKVKSGVSKFCFLRMWIRRPRMGKFVCLFSRIIKEISVRSSLGRKRRDDRRYQ